MFFSVYGALDLEGNPMICSNRDCRSLKGGNWEVSPSLNVVRSFAAMASSVQNSHSGKIIFSVFLDFGFTVQIKTSHVSTTKYHICLAARFSF